jgi:hypothetical protein
LYFLNWSRFWRSKTWRIRCFRDDESDNKKHSYHCPNGMLSHPQYVFVIHKSSGIYMVGAFSKIKRPLAIATETFRPPPVPVSRYDPLEWLWRGVLLSLAGFATISYRFEPVGVRSSL